jgi:hypothetical protein
VLLRKANAGLGRSVVGVGTGGFSISFVGIGVADGLSIGVGELRVSAVASGEGDAPILGLGVGAGYLPLVSPVLSPARVTSQAIKTPEAPRTRTIANTHGNTPLLDSPRASTAPAGEAI